MDKDQHRVGNGTTIGELATTVRGLLELRPQTFKDLVVATGAAPARVQQAVVRLQREGTKIVNMSPIVDRALWFIPGSNLFDRITRVRATSRG